MAYTAIPDSDIDPDSPVTTSLMTLLRDNPIAIANGDSGAPRIQTAGIADNAVTLLKIAQSAAGDALMADFGDYSSGSMSTSPIKLTCSNFSNSRVPRAGTYRFTFTINGFTGYTSYCAIYRNGALLGSWQSHSGATSSAKTQDLTVNEGDIITVYGYNSVGAVSYSVSDIEINESAPLGYSNY